MFQKAACILHVAVGEEYFMVESQDWRCPSRPLSFSPHLKSAPLPTAGGQLDEFPASPFLCCILFLSWELHVIHSQFCQNTFTLDIGTIFHSTHLTRFECAYCLLSWSLTLVHTPLSVLFFKCVTPPNNSKVRFFS